MSQTKAQLLDGKSATIQFTGGSASAPSVSFTGDTNTGIYSPGADQVAISTGGSGRLFVDASGRVSVGTATAQRQFVIYDTTFPVIQLVNSTTGALSNNGLLIYQSGANTGISNQAAGYLALETNNTERLRITSAGLVGVGTSSPGYQLEVSSGATDATALFNSTAATGSHVRFGRSGTIDGYFGCATGFLTSGTSAGDIGIRSQGALALASGGNNNRLFITSAGLVGIGTSSPDAQLDVTRSGNGQIAVLQTSAGRGFNFESQSDTQIQLSSILGSTNLDLWANTVSLSAGGSQRLFVDSSGRVGVGTTSPSSLLELGGVSNPQITLNGTSSLGQRGLIFSALGVSYGEIGQNVNTGELRIRSGQSGQNGYFITFGTGDGSERARIDSSGRVGIGTSSPSYALDVASADTTAGIGYALRLRQNATAGAAAIQFTDNPVTAQYGYIACDSSSNLKFATGLSERARIDSSGRLLVGTSSGSTLRYGSNIAKIETKSVDFHLAMRNDDISPYSHFATFVRSRNNAAVQSGDALGDFEWRGHDGTDVESIAASIGAYVDGTPGANDMPGRLVFSTTRDGQSSPTEAMRINASQQVLIGGTTPDGSQEVMYVRAPAARTGIYIDQESAGGYTGIIIDRTLSDGDLISFLQAGTLEGTISVSGTTVSYNGAHLSRWSQLPLGAERTEILRGSVLSNIDEMCEWTDEENEQLNRMKVSDVEGDKNVSGVFQAWDDDETYTNDFYCAMTGDFIIRIGAGVTVERGDLLMSAGDGTAKPQDDDIIRSKTIAKVTSTNVSCTYDDGSYCVPCVLMAC